MKFRPPHRPRRTIATLAALVALAATWLSGPPALGGAAPKPVRAQLVEVHAPTLEMRNRVATLGLDLTEHGDQDGVQVVLYGAGDERVLRSAGFTWDVLVPDMAAAAQERAEADAEYAASVASSPLPSGRTAYRTVADYEADMAMLAADHPDLVRAFELPHETLEGRTVRGIEVASNVNADDGRPVFLMMGLHHAREWPSGEHTIEFAFDLINNYGTDPRITRLVDRVRTLFVPMVNPDGFHQSRTFPHTEYKRKNCRVVDGQNAPPPLCSIPPADGVVGLFDLGVDLNRNYGGFWGGAGASDVPIDQTYHGAGPFSEPETENIRALVSERQVVTLITNHTLGRLLLRPPGVRATGTTPDEPLLKVLGDRMAAQNGYTSQAGYELYDTTGTTEDWTFWSTGGLGYTFEIGVVDFHPPFEEAVVGEYFGTGEYEGKGNREAYLIALQAAADPDMHSVLLGRAPEGAVLRLTKEFDTPTSRGTVIEDRLETTMLAPGGRFRWHVNPSTRPLVQDRLVPDDTQPPDRTQSTTNDQVILPGDTREVTFELTETDAAELRFALDWVTPDDWDLEIFKVMDDGSRVSVGTSAGFLGDKERVFIEGPSPGTYVAVVTNFAAVNPLWTLTASVFNTIEPILVPGTTETWQLTCERPDGEVLQALQVEVERGEMAKANLGGCIKGF